MRGCVLHLNDSDSSRLMKEVRAFTAKMEALKQRGNDIRSEIMKREMQISAVSAEMEKISDEDDRLQVQLGKAQV